MSAWLPSLRKNLATSDLGQQSNRGASCPNAMHRVPMPCIVSQCHASCPNAMHRVPMPCIVSQCHASCPNAMHRVPMPCTGGASEIAPNFIGLTVDPTTYMPEVFSS
eukprot:Polyplicarium_translucidae@DN3366_c2_g1_i12.p4